MSTNNKCTWGTFSVCLAIFTFCNKIKDFLPHCNSFALNFNVTINVIHWNVCYAWNMWTNKWTDRQLTIDSMTLRQCWPQKTACWGRQLVPGWATVHLYTLALYTVHLYCTLVHCTLVLYTVHCTLVHPSRQGTEPTLPKYFSAAFDILLSTGFKGRALSCHVK